MAELSDQAQTRLAVAALASALAKALDEQEPGFGINFDNNVRRLYDHMREVESASSGLLETLQWTRELYRELR